MEQNNKYQAGVLLVSCIGLLSKVALNHFTKFVDSRYFDKQLHEVVKRKNIPDWFKEEIHWDQVYGKYHNLRSLLQVASRKRLLVYNRSNFSYGVIIVDDEAVELAKSIGVQETDLRNWSRDLNSRLLQVPPTIVKLPGNIQKREFIRHEKGAARAGANLFEGL